MWVQSTGLSVEIDVQQTDAQLPLLEFQLSRNDRAVFSPADFLDIEEMQFVVGPKCDDVDWPLCQGGLENVAPLCHKPRRSDKFSFGTVLNSVIYSH